LYLSGLLEGGEKGNKAVDRRSRQKVSGGLDENEFLQSLKQEQRRPVFCRGFSPIGHHPLYHMILVGRNFAVLIAPKSNVFNSADAPLWRSCGFTAQSDGALMKGVGLGGKGAKAVYALRAGERRNHRREKVSRKMQNRRRDFIRIVRGEMATQGRGVKARKQGLLPSHILLSGPSIAQLPAGSPTRGISKIETWIFGAIDGPEKKLAGRQDHCGLK